MKVDYELYTLKNGLRVLLIPVSSVNSVLVKGFVKAGAALENEKTQGLTHLLEHMALTCTESWPTKEALNRDTEFVGGGLNGSTSKEYLEYYISLPYTKVNFGIKLIYEVLYKALITEENLRTEKTVIIDEISKSIDDVYKLNTDFVYEELYGKKDTYALDVAGTIERVKAFTLEDVKNHYRYSHSPEKVMLAITGNFKPEEIKVEIENTFGKEDYKTEILVAPTPKAKTKLIKSKKNKKTELIFADIIFNYKGYKDSKPEEDFTFSLARSILAGPMSSRLKQRLREKEGLLYGISMGSTTYKDFGMLNISYEIEPRNFEKCFTILNEELEKFRDEGVTDEEIKHYKEYLINRTLLKYDDPLAYAKLIRYPTFMELPIIFPEDVIEGIKKITKEEINKFIKEYLDVKNAHYFTFGNVTKETKDFMIKNITR
jgi:predicted Zn-dependent peptidase